MGNQFVNVDLVRLSQTALPTAKTYDKDKNGTLDEAEYKEFISVWNQSHSNESPLLMQLHIKTLNHPAARLARACDIDEYKGVLTEAEIKNFLELCEQRGIQAPFRAGTSVQAVLTGDTSVRLSSKKRFKDKADNWFNNYAVKGTLFKNWFKLDILSYKGSDKFFHAVGNYEAMGEGAEAIVKKVCAGQHKDKLENTVRSEADFTEDLYANWLGREFYKMYPDKNPHELFEPLAPAGFDTKKSKQNAVRLFIRNASQKEGWLKEKFDEYSGFLKEKYVRQRIWKEFKN